MPNPVQGQWSYRSLLNNPDLAVPFDQLRFVQGTLDLAVNGNDITGTIGGPAWSLDITGTFESEDQIYFLLHCVGNIGGEVWKYDYRGFVVPDWSDGVDQRGALVGLIMRVVQHGSAPAGFVASWYGVRQ